jgi:hypothetical protein
MKSFLQYITEAKVVRVKDLVAYWQPSGSSNVKEGAKVGVFKGRGRWKEVEKMFEEMKPSGLPSRIGSVFVSPTTNNTLFDKSKPIYEVLVTGKVFYTNMELFTEAAMKWTMDAKSAAKSWAEDYWRGENPKRSHEYSEMIVDGKVIVKGEYEQ